MVAVKVGVLEPVCILGAAAEAAAVLLGPVLAPELARERAQAWAQVPDKA